LAADVEHFAVGVEDGAVVGGVAAGDGFGDGGGVVGVAVGPHDDRDAVAVGLGPFAGFAALGLAEDVEEGFGA
jgi:hypothetical protein